MANIKRYLYVEIFKNILKIIFFKKNILNMNVTHEYKNYYKYDKICFFLIIK